MKLLLDSCVWGKANEPLRAAGHDVVYTGDWIHDPGDQQILAVAAQQGESSLRWTTTSARWPSSKGRPIAVSFASLTFPRAASQRHAWSQWSHTKTSWKQAQLSPSNRAGSAFGLPRSKRDKAHGVGGENCQGGAKKATERFFASLPIRRFRSVSFLSPRDSIRPNTGR